MPILSCPSPANLNPLMGSGNYQFSLVKFPEISFMLQSAEIPSMSLGVSILSSSVHDYPVPGESLSYADFTCSFIVDEKLSNYMAIYEWIVGLGYPENHQMYRDLLANSKNQASLSELAKSATDGVLTILGNNNLPVAQAHFRDAFPTQLGAIEFRSTNSDSEPIIANVTFAYSYYTMSTI